MFSRPSMNFQLTLEHLFSPKRRLETRRIIRDRAPMDAELLAFIEGHKNPTKLSGAILLDASWDNPHYWYRVSLIMSALGCSTRQLHPVLGQWSHREISATLKSWNTAVGIKLLDRQPPTVQSKSEAKALLLHTHRPEDIFDWELPEEFPSRIFYDALLKAQRLGVVDLQHSSLHEDVARGLARIHAAGNVVRENQYDLGLFSHNLGEIAGPLAWCSMKAGIPSYVLYGDFGGQRFLRLEGPEQFSMMATAPTPEILASLSDTVRDRLQHVGQQYMAARFSGQTGDIGAQMAFGDKQGAPHSATDDFVSQFGWSKEKPIVCVYLSNWFDYPHSLGMGQYRDFMEWFEITLDVARESDHVNWLIRGHPLDQLYGPANTHSATSMARKLNVTHVAACPDGVDGRTIQSTVVGAITCFGSIGLELPYLGKPVLAADTGWYGKCGFVTLPKDPDEYRRILKTKWWEDIDLAHRKTISEVFAGLYYGCPEWQDGLITLDDSKQWGLYGPIIQLLKEASTQMNREVETLSKWLVNDNPHYHNFKMLEAEDFFPGTMEHSILQT